MAVLLALPIGALWYMDGAEKQESQFKSYRDLQASGLIEKGWVPEFIPRSAYEIHERHRVDVAGVNVAFRFSPGDVALVEAACTKQAGGPAYTCAHRSGVVKATLSSDGSGRIVSE